MVKKMGLRLRELPRGQDEGPRNLVPAFWTIPVCRLLGWYQALGRLPGTVDQAVQVVEADGDVRGTKVHHFGVVRAVDVVGADSWVVTQPFRPSVYDLPWFPRRAEKFIYWGKTVPPLLQCIWTHEAFLEHLLVFLLL